VSVARGTGSSISRTTVECGDGGKRALLSSSDDVASPVWDLDVFAGFDYESESGWKPPSEDLCREAHRVLKEPLDTLDSDASIVHLRRQVSYIRLEADFLGARVRMFYKEKYVAGSCGNT